VKTIAQESRLIQRIVIIDKDPFSRNWISQLLMRDWRTQVVYEADSIKGFSLAIEGKELQRIDGVVVNLDNFQMDTNCLNNLFMMSSCSTKILLVSTNEFSEFLDFINKENFGGYLIKSEVEISIAWAMIKAIQGYFIISKTIEDSLFQSGIMLNKNILVFDGIEASEFLTESENRNAHLAFVFSMSRGNMADELTITPKSSWTLISTLYGALGIKDLLLGDDWINFNLDQDCIINDHVVSVRNKRSDTSNAATKETLAFHVYTKPKMHKFSSIK